VSVTSLSDGWRRVTLDLSSLPSQGLLLDFSQFGFDDGLSSTVQLDNVLVNVVPEPSLLTVWAGLCLLVLARRLKARSSEKRNQDGIQTHWPLTTAQRSENAGPANPYQQSTEPSLSRTATTSDAPATARSSVRIDPDRIVRDRKRSEPDRGSDFDLHVHKKAHALCSIV
jgi:hypothetical protein